jgi:hypothetical protein
MLQGSGIGFLKGPSARIKYHRGVGAVVNSQGRSAKKRPLEQPMPRVVSMANRPIASVVSIVATESMYALRGGQWQ